MSLQETFAGTSEERRDVIYNAAGVNRTFQVFFNTNTDKLFVFGTPDATTGVRPTHAEVDWVRSAYADLVPAEQAAVRDLLEGIFYAITGEAPL